MSAARTGTVPVVRHHPDAIAAAFASLVNGPTEGIAIGWLVHYADGWSLAIRGHGMASLRPRAGTTGPTWRRGDRVGPDGARPFGPLDAEALGIVERVWRRHGDWTTGDFAVANMQPGNPWHDASATGSTIGAEATARHFTALALAGRAEAGP